MQTGLSKRNLHAKLQANKPESSLSFDPTRSTLFFIVCPITVQIRFPSRALLWLALNKQLKRVAAENRVRRCSANPQPRRTLRLLALEQ